MTVDLAYVARVRRILLSAETKGITYQDLLKRVRTKQHGTQDLRQVLNAWRKRKWVDNFASHTQLHGGTPKQVWRATVLLENEWPATQAMIRDTIATIALDPSVALEQGASRTQTSPPAEEDPEQKAAE